MYIMKRLWILGLCLLLAAGAQAQEVYNSSGRTTRSKPQKKSGFDPQRLVIGGGLGLGFGNVTNIGVSPRIGYRITDQFAAGVSLGYQYFKVNDFYEVYNPGKMGYDYYDYKTSMYSGGVWARYAPLQWLFAHVEYEHNFMTITNYRYAQTGTGAIEAFRENYNAPSLLVGPGFRQPMGEHSSFNVMLLYDVIQNKYSPYYNRITPSIGFLIGF